MTALMEACVRGESELTAVLLDSAANIAAKDDAGESVILKAAREGHARVVTLLLQRGAYPDPRAVRWAAAGGHLDVVKLLLDCGADANSTNEAGVTALMRAALMGHPQVVSLLLDSGADVEAKDQEGWPPLILVCREGHTDVARLIIEIGADVNVKDNHGWTPLIWASSLGSRRRGGPATRRRGQGQRTRSDSAPPR